MFFLPTFKFLQKDFETNFQKSANPIDNFNNSYNWNSSKKSQWASNSRYHIVNICSNFQSYFCNDWRIQEKIQYSNILEKQEWKHIWSKAARHKLKRLCHSRVGTVDCRWDGNFDLLHFFWPIKFTLAKTEIIYSKNVRA